MKRTKHNLSHYNLATMDMGQLVPISAFEALPGDSIRMSTSALLRVSPLMTPVMHPVHVRIHHWFVPYRLSCPVVGMNWESFITGGDDGMDAQTFAKTGATTVEANSPADYMGVPPGNGRVFAFAPMVAYFMVFNEFYRDQDLQPEYDIIADGAGNLAAHLRNIAWEKDYFTACRPWTQKGPDVTLPIGATAPIIGTGAPSFATPGGPSTLAATTSSPQTQWTTIPTGALQNIPWSNPQLMADLSQATSATVNDVRLAFALQRYQEARAQYGSRFTEYLRYLGVTSSDARLQRPEYLGGGRATISFSEVLRTGNESTQTGAEGVIGEMRGHGISALRSRTFTRFFEEHGTVLTLVSLRPRTMYMQGQHRSWSRTTKEDFWQKELEQIGQQEVFNREIYADHTTPDGVFGYQDRYADYRHLPSYVSGEFRTLLSDWHMARDFATPPALNSEFVECVPTKRIHAEQTQNSIWGMFSHRVSARRLVGNRTIGRIF